MNLRWSIIGLLLILNYAGFSQISRLANPSFEDEPQDATTPVGWDACGRTSTPDILPGFWGVMKEPVDGNTYIGLITREDNTWEKIGQTLRVPLKAGECYSVNMHLARSASYAGYTRPVKIKIWGGATKCGKDELLAETRPVVHYDWKPYELFFIPKKEIKYIIIEAYYISDVPYRGNILLDNFSVIKKCIRA